MRLEIRWIDGWAHVHGTGPNGQRIRRSLKTRDPGQAAEAKAALEARLWKTGLYGPGHVITFEEAALRYAEDGGEARFLEPIARALAGRRLADITPIDIRLAARQAYPNAAPATMNRQGITPARAVINFAHAQGWCPMIRVRGFDVPKPQRTAVNRSYIDQLRPHLPARLFALMLFLHTTGRRIGDALALDRADIDLGQRRALIRDPKNGQPVVAVLTAELAEILAQVLPDSGPAFAYAHRSSLYGTLRRATKKARLAYLGTHQPGRHSFATTLNEAGFGAKDIASAGGWKSPRLVQETYIHADTAAERAAKVFGKKLSRKKSG